MPILSIQTGQVGLVDTLPELIYINTNDTYATVTTTGYLSSSQREGFQYSNKQMALVQTSDDGPVWLQVSVSAGVVSLVEITAPGDVVLPTITNHLIVSTNTTGTLANLTGTAINNGSIQAGLSGTAGTLISYPGTASKGSLIVAGVANTGNTNTTISNAAMGQASVISIPDPAAATADFVLAPSALVSGNAIKASGTAGLVVDGGYAFHAGTTGTYGGGGTSNAFTVTGMASTWIVTAVILTSTNSVSITKAVPSTNTLTITFSADPGAGTTVSWIASTASV